MNRSQRRKLMKERFRLVEGAGRNEAPDPAQKDFIPDYSQVPPEKICEGIEILLSELRKKDFPVYDFDNKDKVVYGIRIIGGKAYFLAVTEGKDEEQKQEENQ